MKTKVVDFIPISSRQYRRRYQHQVEKANVLFIAISNQQLTVIPYRISNKRRHVEKACLEGT